MDCDWCGRRGDVAALLIDEVDTPPFQARLCSVCQVLLGVGSMSSLSGERTEWARGQVFRHLVQRGPAGGIPSLRCATCGTVVPLNLVQHDDTGHKVLVCPQCRDRHVLSRHSDPA